MYTAADFHKAQAQLRKWALVLAAILLPLSAAYVLGAVQDRYALMLACMLVGFVCAMLICDLALLPALRYHRFLRNMQQGLRHETDGTLRSLDALLQMQDGVQVRALQVEMPDGDRRMFYVNTHKAALLPEMDQAVHIVSFGRHVLDCRLIHP